MKRKKVICVLASLLVMSLCVAVVSIQAAGAKKVTIHMQIDEFYHPETRPIVAAITKEIVNEYMKLYPNVTLVLGDYMPIGEFYTWFTTKMSVKDAPEFVYSLRQERVMQKGWWVALDKYLEEENPYIPEGYLGHDRWGDILPDWAWEGIRHPDGYIYEAPLEATGGCTLYYNKDKFKEMGLTVDWPTWTDFVNTGRKLKNTGHGVGIYMSSGSSYRWLESCVLSAFFAKKGKDMLMPKYTEQAGGQWKTWRTLSVEELSKAIYDEKFSALDPRFVEYLKATKDLSKDWVEGYATLSRDEAYSLFGMEKILLGYYGLFSLKPIKEVSEFDWDVVQLPAVTPEISEYVTGELFMTGGGPPNDGYGITTVAEDKGIVEECIDFLKFWSTADHAGRQFYAFPVLCNIQGVKQNPDLAPFMAVFQPPNKTRLFGDYTARLGPKAGDEWLKVTQDYIGGQIDVKKAQTKFQKILDDAVELLAGEYKWEWYK